MDPEQSSIKAESQTHSIQVVDLTTYLLLYSYKLKLKKGLKSYILYPQSFSGWVFSTP